MKCLNGIFNTEGLFWNLHAILFWEIIFCLLMCAFYSKRVSFNLSRLWISWLRCATCEDLYFIFWRLIHSFIQVCYSLPFISFSLKKIYIFYFLLKYGRELETKSLIWLIKISSFHKTSLNYTIIDKFLSRKISKISSHKEF